MRVYIPTAMAVACSLAAVSGQTAPGPLQKRQALVLRLDSLELAKQDLKRLGKDISELDRSTTVIRDSLSALRSVIAAQPLRPEAAPKTRVETTTPERSVSLPGGRGVIALPQNPLDWLIVGIGGVAILSGIVLLVGLVQSWVGGAGARKRRERAPTASEKKAQNRIAPLPGAPRAVPPVKTGPAEAVHPRPVPETEAMEALRKRMGQDDAAARSVREARPPGATPRVRNEVSPARSRSTAPTTGGDMKDAVLAAAREGLSPQDISRKFQLSTDQVTLLLRVTQHIKAVDRNEESTR